MKNCILTIAILCTFSNLSIGQATLLHSFSGGAAVEGAIVDLSRSGKKLMVMKMQSDLPIPDTIFFYNLDFSFWKMIPCPHLRGLFGRFNFYSEEQDVTVHYPSELFFNTDTFLEVAVYYIDSNSTSASFQTGKYYVINENGSIVDSMPNAVAYHATSYRAYKDSAGAYKLVVSTINGIDIYGLPGSLPCDACGGSLGMVSIEKPINNILSQPVPNPSKDEVKITFTLPEGVSRGELQLFATDGKRIRTYQVDNRFGFIMLDNSQLAPGMYYYNIVVNGQISATQKLLVIK